MYALKVTSSILDAFLQWDTLIPDYGPKYLEYLPILTSILKQVEFANYLWG